MTFGGKEATSTDSIPAVEVVSSGEERTIEEYGGAGTVEAGSGLPLSWSERIWRDHKNLIICHSALLATQFIFATNLTLTKAAFQFAHVEVSPLIIIAPRCIIATLTMTFIHFFLPPIRERYHRHRHNLKHRRVTAEASGHHSATTESPPSATPQPPLPQKLQLQMLGLGALGIGLNLMFFIYGVSMTDAITAAALMCTVPPLCFVLSYMLGMETFSWIKAFSLLCAIVGNFIMASAWEMITGNSSTHSPTYYLGVMCLVLNTIAWSCYMVLQKPMVEKVPRMTFLFYVYVGGCTVIVICALFKYQIFLDQMINRPLPAIVWVVIFYAGFINSIVPYYLTALAIKLASPAIPATYTVLQPVIVGVEALMFLGETLTAGKLFGGGLALMAVATAAYGQYRDAKEKHRKAKESSKKEESAFEQSGTSEMQRKGKRKRDPEGLESSAVCGALTTEESGVIAEIAIEGEYPTLHYLTSDSDDESGDSEGELAIVPIGSNSQGIEGGPGVENGSPPGGLQRRLSTKKSMRKRNPLPISHLSMEGERHPEVEEGLSTPTST